MRWSPFLIGLCLSLLCVCLYVPGLGDPPFSTKGEAREATVAWEVWHSGEWVLPLRNGQIIPSKPPLFHWLGALVSVAWGEMNELTIRLPSALLGIVGILLTYTTGTALWGVEAGVIAAVILATSFAWMQAATAARVDMTLTGCMLAALFFFLFVYRRRTVSRAQALLFFALLGLATLAKGPVGALLPGLIIGVFLLVRRDIQFLRQMHIFSGVTLLIGIVAAWYSLALWQGGEEFWSKVMTENVDRFVSGVAHKHPFYFFVPKLFLGLAPWSIFFPPLALYLYQRRRTWAEDGFLYFLVWVGTVFLFYSASSGKRSVYILPLYPALALLLGAWWSELIRGSVAFPKHAVWLVRGGGYVSLLLGGLAVGIVFAQCLGFDVFRLVGPLFPRKILSLLPFAADSMAAHPGAFVVWFGVVGPAVFFLAWSIWQQQWRGVFGSMAIFIVSTFLLVHGVVRPAIATARTLRPFMQRVVENVGEASLFFYRAFDDEALYYAGRRIPWCALSLVQPGRPYFFLTWQEEWDKVTPQAGMQVVEVSEVTSPEVNQRLVLVSVPSGMPVLAETPVSAQTALRLRSADGRSDLRFSGCPYGKRESNPF